MIDFLLIFLVIYIVLGVIALNITIFGFKAVPRGNDAIIKSIFFIMGWIVVAPILWFEIVNGKNTKQ